MRIHAKSGGLWLIAALVALMGVPATRGSRVSGAAEKSTGQFPWGHSGEDVRQGQQVAPDPGLSKADKLVFRSKALGQDALLEYVFTEDRLTKVRWSFLRCFEPQRLWTKAPAGQCIRDYLQIRKRLIKRYGEPQESGAAGTREGLKAPDLALDIRDPERLSFIEQTIRGGAAYWYTKWKAEGTSTLLLLTGGQGEISLVAEFTRAEGEEGAHGPPSPEDHSS